jgi:hypothetical protein
MLFVHKLNPYRIFGYGSIIMIYLYWTSIFIWDDGGLLCMRSKIASVLTVHSEEVCGNFLENNIKIFLNGGPI